MIGDEADYANYSMEQQPAYLVLVRVSFASSVG